MTVLSKNQYNQQENQMFVIQSVFYRSDYKLQQRPAIEQSKDKVKREKNIEWKIKLLQNHQIVAFDEKKKEKKEKKEETVIPLDIEN